MKRLRPEELKALLDGGECELVDVREAVEWANGRVGGARHVALGDLAARCGEIGRNGVVVVMCQSGKRSRQAAALLRERGIANVQELEGGFTAWETAGFETERDERAPWRLERQVRLAAGLLVLGGLSLSLLWPGAIALSWFVGAGLVFAALTDWCGMGMLLSKAPWNRIGRARPCNESCQIKEA
jgi:rhodanese-related sulfurtransferase